MVVVKAGTTAAERARPRAVTMDTPMAEKTAEKKDIQKEGM